MISESLADDQFGEIRVRVTHVFGEPLALVLGDEGGAGDDAPKRGGNIIHIIHHSNQFTTLGHVSSCGMPLKNCSATVQAISSAAVLRGG